MRGCAVAAGECPLAVPHPVRPGVENLTAGVRRRLFAGESFDDAHAAFHVRAQRRAHLGHHGALVAVGNGNLFS